MGSVLRWPKTEEAIIQLDNWPQLGIFGCCGYDLASLTAWPELQPLNALPDKGLSGFTEGDRPPQAAPRQAVTCWQQ